MLQKGEGVRFILSHLKKIYFLICGAFFLLLSRFDLQSLISSAGYI